MTLPSNESKQLAPRNTIKLEIGYARSAPATGFVGARSLVRATANVGGIMSVFVNATAFDCPEYVWPCRADAMALYFDGNEANFTASTAAVLTSCESAR